VNISVIAASDNHNLHAEEGVLIRNEGAGVFGGIWNPSQITRILNHGLHRFGWAMSWAEGLVDYILEKPLHRNILIFNGLRGYIGVTERLHVVTLLIVNDLSMLG
jgi:hypothetical protein